MKRALLILNNIKLIIESTLLVIMFKQLTKIGTNITYKFKAYTDQVSLQGHVWILGKHFDLDLPKERQEFLILYRSVIWFSYRESMRLEESSMQSDVGWGCMYRVGQMVMAEALKRSFKIEISEKKDLINIIAAFIDNPNKDSGNYSFKNLLAQSKKELKLTEGEWLNPSHIAFLLKQVHIKRPIKNSDNLQIISCNNSMLQVQNIAKKMQDCKCSYGDYQSDDFPECLSCSKQKKKIDKRILLFIFTRLSIKSPKPEKLAILKEYLKIRSSIGIVGGRPRQALYILGVVGNKFIYLDPHCVQQADSLLTVEEHLDNYFCKQVRGLHEQSLDSSLGLAYYLQSLQDLKDLVKLIEDIDKQNQNQNFICVKMHESKDEDIYSSYSFK